MQLKQPQKRAIPEMPGARWRIELIFKQWKSCLKIDMFKGYNEKRFHCFLYGRLAMIFLLGALYPPLMRYALRLGRELSSYKVTNYLLADHALFRALQEGMENQLLKDLFEDIPRRLCMDKRKKRPSLKENVRSGNTSYSLLDISDFSEYCHKLA